MRNILNDNWKVMIALGPVEETRAIDKDLFIWDNRLNNTRIVPAQRVKLEPDTPPCLPSDITAVKFSKNGLWSDFSDVYFFLDHWTLRRIWYLAWGHNNPFYRLAVKQKAFWSNRSGRLFRQTTSRTLRTSRS